MLTAEEGFNGDRLAGLTEQLSNQEFRLPRRLGRRSQPTARKRGRKLVQDDIDAMMRSHQAGTTISALAEEYGVHRHTVGARLKAVGCTCGWPKLDAADVEVIAKRYKSGESSAAVASDYGVDPVTIRTALRREGHDVRPRPGWSY